ncbi:hypothetical protein ONZ45_g5362 [Pleurotus djamor]|nr:hypothetical protein ONZ45_g5362 [Pleurotus djamor]
MPAALSSQPIYLNPFVKPFVVLLISDRRLSEIGTCRVEGDLAWGRWEVVSKKLEDTATSLYDHEEPPTSGLDEPEAANSTPPPLSYALSHDESRCFTTYPSSTVTWSSTTAPPPPSASSTQPVPPSTVVFQPRGLAARPLSFLLRRPAVDSGSGGRHAPPPRYHTSGDQKSLRPPSVSTSHSTLRFAALQWVATALRCFSSQTFRRNIRFYTDFKYKNCLKLLKPSISYPLRAGLEGQGDRPVQGRLLGRIKFKLTEMRGMLVVDSASMKLRADAIATNQTRQR